MGDLGETGRNPSVYHGNRSASKKGIDQKVKSIISLSNG